MVSGTTTRNPYPFWFQTTIFGVTYFFCCYLCSFLTNQTSQTEVIWPASGLFLSVLLLAPFRNWKWLFLAAGIAQIFYFTTIHRSIFIALAFFVVNAIEAGLAAYAIRKILGDKIEIDKPKNLFIFLGFSIFSTMLAATFGAILTISFMFSQNIWQSWIIWWFADLIGIVIFAPLILVGEKYYLRGISTNRIRKISEIAVLILTVFFLTWLVSGESGQFAWVGKFTLVVLLLFVSARFALPGAVLANLAIVVARLGQQVSVLDHLGFDQNHQIQLWMEIQLMILIVSIMALFHASLIVLRGLQLHRRDSFNKQLLEIFDNLESIVYVFESETGKLVHLNIPGKNVFGVENIGRDFYALASELKYIGFNRSDRSNINWISNVTQTEIYQENTGQWFQCIEKTGFWLERRHVRIGTMFDITDRKRAEVQLREATDRTNRFYRATIQLGNTLESAEIYETARQLIGQCMDCDSISISTYNEQHQTIKCRAYYSDNNWIDVSQFPELPLVFDGKGIQATVIKSKESTIIADYNSQVAPNKVIYSDDLENTSAISDRTNSVMRSAIVVPLLLANRATGIVQIFSSHSNAFDSEKLRMAESIAAQIAVTVNNATLYRDSREEVLDRQRIEMELRSSEERFNGFLNTVNDAVYRYNIDSNSYDFISPSTAQLLGIPLEKLLQDPRRYTQMCTHPTDWDRTWVEIEEFHTKGPSKRPLQLEYRVVKPDGTYRWLLDWKTYEYDSRGKPIVINGVIRDVTEIKQTEQALRESEAKFNKFLNKINDVVYRYNQRENRYEFISPSIEKMTGIPFETFVRDPSKVILEITHPDDQLVIDKMIKDCWKRANPDEVLQCEYRIKMPDGSYRWMHDSKSYEYGSKQEPIITNGVVTDITAKKTVEDSLRSSEEQFRNMFEHHDAIMALIDPESGRILDANNAAEKFYGFVREQLKTMTTQDVNTFSREEAKAVRIQAMRKEKNRFIFNHRLANGESRIVEVHFSPLVTGGKTVLFAIIHDVTDRESMEQALRDKEEKFRTIADFTFDWELWVDNDGNLLYTSPSCEAVTGYSREEFLAQPTLLAQIVWSEDRKLFEEHNCTAREDENARHIIYRIVHKSGDLVWIHHSCVRVVDSEGNTNGRRISCRNITWQKNVEAEREKLIQELQVALSEVRKLSGLLPICSNCKKIRDDRGYWGQIEQYITEHSTAQFTHSICPDCLKKLYPETYFENSTN